MKKLIIFLAVCLISFQSYADEVFSISKWTQMSDAEKIRIVKELVKLGDEAKEIIEGQDKLLAKQEKEIYEMGKQLRAKQKRFGFGAGIEGGFGYLDKNNFQNFFTDVGISSAFYVIAFERFFFSPSIHLSVWENVSAKLGLSIGFLF